MLSFVLEVVWQTRLFRLKANQTDGMVTIGLLPAAPQIFGALFLAVSVPKRLRAGQRAVCCHGASGRKRFLDGHGFVWLCVEFGSVPGKPPHA